MSASGETVIVDVHGIGKRYLLHPRGVQTVKAASLDWIRGRRAPKREFWALRDVSFRVHRGETLGIVGANGAGKSTLLSLVAGTRAATKGTIRTHGTIASLLELGAGFHPELTGRENVFLAGAIMGLSRAHMARRFDAIVEFADLSDFIDQPVKQYSSGMYVRLGFAVSMEVDPDILLLDEVLAVGDVAFQRKCLNRLDAFRKSDKTLLIVSHDLETVKKMSSRILFLDAGRVQGLGDPEAMVERFESHALAGSADGLGREWGTGEVRIESVELLNAQGEAATTYAWGDPLIANIHYRASEHIADPVFGFAIADAQGRLLYGNNSQIEGVTMQHVEGEGVVTLRIEQLMMGRGTYLLSFSVHSSDHKINYHRLDHAFPIVVNADRAFEGCYMPVSWTRP